jgi:hypothetical protein
MNLKILRPFRIFAAETGVLPIVAETPEGSFGLWPHRLDGRILRVFEFMVAAVPLAFVLGAMLLKLANPAYGLLVNTISELAVGPWGIVLTVLFYLMGLSTLYFAWKLLRLHPTSVRLRLGVLAIAVCSVIFILLGAFQTDIAGQARTLHGYVHEYITGILMFLFPVAAFLIAPVLKHAFRSGGWLVFSRTAGSIAVVLMLVMWVVFADGFSVLGIMERLVMVNSLAWVQVINLRTLLG